MKVSMNRRLVSPAERARYVVEAIRLLRAKGKLRRQIVEAAIQDAIQESHVALVRSLATVAVCGARTTPSSN